MYVESVSMTDFRCFAKAETTFVYPGVVGLPDGALPNVTLLIGINGAGKTSLLKAVALACLSPIISQAGYFPSLLVRRSPRKVNDPVESVVTCHTNESFEYPTKKDFGLNDPPHTSIYIERHNELEYFWKFHWMGHNYALMSAISHPIAKKLLEQEQSHDAGTLTSFSSDSSPHYFLLGYGASRRSEYLENLDAQRSRRRHPRFQRVACLFEEFITLYPLAAWYPLLKSKARIKEVRELLNSLLPKKTQFTGECEGGEGLFNNDGVTLPFGALSDGFRSYIGLLADMLYNMHTVSPKGKLTDLAGVVIIDDIDIHLHPGWQREIVPKLAETFPKLQFIITTHSPLVVGTVHAANIRVVEENQIRQFTEQTDGKSADQILMSSYFGLESPRSPDKQKRLKKTAKRVANTHDPAAAVEFLKELTGQT
jgi:AAA domain, putative AbiEii toxin, Type IV TA system